MAVVNSVFLGTARKSAGNGTFRTVRGRTIASQKVSKTGPYNGPLTLNQFALAMVSRYASLYAEDIDVSFDKTTYGSARNAFFKLNYGAMKDALRSLWADSLQTGAARYPSDAQLTNAIGAYAQANPNTIYRKKKAGEAIEYLAGNWDGSDVDTNPDSGGDTSGGGGNSGSDFE